MVVLSIMSLRIFVVVRGGVKWCNCQRIARNFAADDFCYLEIPRIAVSIVFRRVVGSR